jgi:hypothetical protein
LLSTQEFVMDEEEETLDLDHWSCTEKVTTDMVGKELVCCSYAWPCKVHFRNPSNYNNQLGKKIFKGG